MKLTDKKTKIIATIGPSSNNYETLKELVLAGVTTVRANFSHGTHEEQNGKFELAKQISKELNVPISLMLDTKGPEIRIGQMKDGAQKITANSKIKIFTGSKQFKEHVGTSSEITVSYQMDKDLKVGDLVLIDDGKLKTVVLDIKKGEILVEAQNDHKLKTNKRINLPGVEFSLPFLAKKDIADIKFGIKKGINYVAASFVNSAANIKELRTLLNENGGKHVQIIAKIESHVGTVKIDEIIKVSDGIMVARGDLGLEIPFQDVPYYQKKIIRKCRLAGKPVIVATQMLDSMENHPHPTRAEVTDVYWATELGADSTMLSGESAQGDFPLLAVKTMATINERAEREFYQKLFYDMQLKAMIASSKGKRAEIAKEIALTCQKDKVDYVVVLSRTGKLLKEVAKFRPNAPIIGILNDEAMIGAFGVTSSVYTSLDSLELFKEIKQDSAKAIDAVKPYGIKKGDIVLVVENDKITKLVAKRI
ncbi:pyruvate kinase [Mycoplasma iguanae]|uniref:Pyruvate kinase n=1 Tax=Mycoplasma iguanae TaxID=292461 RepID=A0ABY5R8N8_9MOLU|nr:pyruvate kinase [Mycoplasma iguanae]UVD81858.1 pyruvate kinase [Mycoplasma iguanae]